MKGDDYLRVPQLTTVAAEGGLLYLGFYTYKDVY